MREVDRYVSEVMRNIHLSARERARIEADLRAHLGGATADGEPVEAAILRMGSPAQVAEAFMSTVKFRYAGILRRLAAFVVDVVVCAIVGVPLAFLGVALANIPAEAREWSWWANAAIIGLAASLSLGALAMFILYFPILEGRFGRTLGKRLFGIRVLRENGLAIGYKEGFLRRIPFYFRFALLDALFIPFTAKKQRAFDIVARTVVVRDE